MKKHILITAGLLGGLFSAHAQVNVIFKNESNFGMNVYLNAGGSYVDSIPAHSQTVHLRLRKISDRERISLIAQNGIFTLNVNLPGTTYTKGDFIYTIVWDDKRKTYSAILKPL